MCGLESLDQGTRLLNGASLVNGELHPGITMLFQQPVLYPHLTVAQNIGLGAPKGTKKHQRQSLATDVLETLGMPGFERRRIAQLSGGCLLYTSDAADEGLGVDLGGRRII